MTKILEIEATRVDIPTSLFSDLSTLFKDTFDRFPSNDSFVATYKSCQNIVSKLSSKYSYDD